MQQITSRRRQLAARYFELFDRSLGCTLPVADMKQSNWHMFQVLLPEGFSRGDYIAKMHEAGIGIGVHYPAMHLFTLYRKLGFKEGQFPLAERVGRSIVTLPLFPSMQDSDVERVCAATAQVLRAPARRTG
jgi:dTDP-4-amino-4,6-dideoxygalactose transaminase